MEFLYNYNGKCEIDSSTKIPVMDDNYFDNHSVYEKCKCINKLKENLKILVIKEPAKYNAYLDIYKNKYLENKCDEVFKNYVKTNSQEIYASVTQEDKARIEADSIKQRNTRLYIGVSVLFVAIGMIAIYGTRKN